MLSVMKIHLKEGIPISTSKRAYTTSKGKTSVNNLVSNYTNKHVTFNKGEYIGHLKTTMEEIPQTSESPDATTTNSITTEK